MKFSSSVNAAAHASLPPITSILAAAPYAAPKIVRLLAITVINGGTVVAPLVEVLECIVFAIVKCLCRVQSGVPGAEESFKS
jgi:hypothetical protein